MPGRGTTDAIFVVRQLMEKHREHRKDCIVFIDLENAYDRVTRQQFWICVRDNCVPAKYVMIVGLQDMYEGGRTRIQSRV